MKSGEVISDDAPFRSMMETILEATDLNKTYNKAVDKLMESMATFQM